MLVNKALIAKIRTNFLAAAKKRPNAYHSLDVERVAQKDWWVERFVLTNKSEDSALKALIKAMKWRKSFGVNDFTDQTFPEEMHKMGYFAAPFCTDRENRPVLWIQTKHYRKCTEWSPLLKQFLVYQYERLDRECSHEGWVVVVDTTGAGLGNMEMDFNNFFVDVLQNYYPKGIKYMFAVDMPWILTATARVMVSFMNEHLKAVFLAITSAELTKYMAPDVIPVHLKGTYDKLLVCVPPGVRPLAQHPDFTADQIHKIYFTFKWELN